MSADSIQIGKVRVTCLSDCVLYEDPLTFFRNVNTMEAWEPYMDHLRVVAMRDPLLELRRSRSSAAQGPTAATPGAPGSPEYHIELNVGAYVVQSDHDVVLVDTGMGPHRNPQLIGDEYFKLPDAMRRAGIEPADVTVVAATHLHGDHVGWHVTVESGIARPTFPRARYILSKDEYDFTFGGKAGYPAEYMQRIEPFKSLRRLELVGDRTAITSEVTAIATPGHTPGHVCFLVSSDGGKLIVLGDSIHNPAQITETKWLSISDVDPQKASRTRTELVTWMADEQVVIAGGHFPHPGYGRAVPSTNRFRWEQLKGDR